MLKITIPIFFNPPGSEDQVSAGISIPPSELLVKECRLFLTHVVAYFERVYDDKPYGTTIETDSGIYITSLTPRELDRVIENAIEWEEARIMNIDGEETDIDSQINNILNPSEKTRRE